MPPMRWPSKQELGCHLRALREELDFSQEDLASGAELPLADVRLIEAGMKEVDLDELTALARALKMAIYEIFSTWEIRSGARSRPLTR